MACLTDERMDSMTSQSGNGNKAFSASAARRGWHFAAITYTPSTQTITAYYDGRQASSALWLCLFASARATELLC